MNDYTEITMKLKTLQFEIQRCDEIILCGLGFMGLSVLYAILDIGGFIEIREFVHGLMNFLLIFGVVIVYYADRHKTNLETIVKHICDMSNRESDLYE